MGSGVLKVEILTMGESAAAGATMEWAGTSAMTTVDLEHEDDLMRLMAAITVAHANEVHLFVDGDYGYMHVLAPMLVKLHVQRVQVELLGLTYNSIEDSARARDLLLRAGFAQRGSAFHRSRVSLTEVDMALPPQKQRAAGRRVVGGRRP